ncbi:MAG: PQQ-like beta-propeller repeat protein [Planctomycetes bacterium]|nr:PQQ-like beta-propeller repeat protein [Planctomycetota bacterium]
MSFSIALTFSLSCAALFGDGADWPCWRGPQRDGISRETRWSDRGAEQPLWSKQVGLGYSNVSIARGRLFTFGFDEERSVDVLYALDAATGAELWRHEHPAKKWDNMHAGGTLTTPIVEGERVFALSRMGQIFALDFAQGRVLWERDLVKDLEVSTGEFGLPSSPLVLDEILYLNVGKLVALRAATGAIVWATPDYGYSYATPTPFDWKGRACLAVFNAAGLVVADRASGAELSRHEWKSQYNVNCASPIPIGERMFISTGYNELGCAMLELAEKTPKVLWQSKEMRSKMNGCVLHQEHLYGFDAGILKCLDLAGNTRWSERGLGMGTVIVAGDRLIVLAEKGELLIAPASPESFAPTFRTQVLPDGKCWTTPVLSHGLLYLRNSRGELVCRDHRLPSGGAGR